jgi:glucan phosphorylase
LLEHEVVPQFYDRDANGIPRAWVARVKRSLRTLGPRFSATRMVEDYVRDVYKP